MKKLYLLFFCITFAFSVHSQTGYDIKINFKGNTDTTLFLARYFWDQLPITDSCKKVKNGKIRFKGDMPLDQGVYFLANQAKTSFYFQFIVGANQKFTINVDAEDVGSSMTADEKENQQFFSYVKFMTNKNKEMNGYIEQSHKMNKADSAKFIGEKQVTLNAQTTKFDADFMTANKGTFVHALMNLKNEKYATDVPKASNGRPDSIYQFYYYKSHFFEGVNFKDDRLLSTPFFADKVKKYYEKLIVQHPDTFIKELDFVLGQCEPGSKMFNTLLGHFTYKFEQDKSMSFDQYGNSLTYEKVFVHLADKYIVPGKTNGYYSDETVKKIKERVDILRHLLPGAKVPDLFMVDTTHGREVLKMGFDTARTSLGVTNLYHKNYGRLSSIYKTLYEIKAKYTVLVFWAADCGHCQKEIPKLHEDIQGLMDSLDIKVFAVQTKEELFDSWKQFIIDKKLKRFIHVFDPVHLNNLKDQFDINATPVIYLLDKDKKIKGKKLSHEQVVDIIRNLEKIEKNINK